jgi:hypothetical protein
MPPIAFRTAILIVLYGLAPAVEGAEASRLDARELLSGTGPATVIDNRAFIAGPSARPAHAPFDGDLIVSEGAMQTVPSDLKVRSLRGKDARYFPAVRLSFITVDGDLVPKTQDVIRTGFASKGRSYWDIIVQPGRVWSEPADGGWSRAAFPFALVNSLEGETHNGLAIFLYRRHEVSALRYQIVQQTLPGNVETIFTVAGSVPARAESSAPIDATMIARRYRAALADAVPVHPWIELEQQVGKEALAGFADGLPAKYTILSGLDYNGAFYLQECESAGGPLPWCDRARFGVWSVTKSFINEIALLRLAQKYGPEVFKAKIVDYVPAARSYPLGPMSPSMTASTWRRASATAARSATLTTSRMDSSTPPITIGTTPYQGMTRFPRCFVLLESIPGGRGKLHATVIRTNTSWASPWTHSSKLVKVTAPASGPWSSARFTNP